MAAGPTAGVYPASAFPVGLDTLNPIGPGGPSEQTPNPQGQSHQGIHAQLAAVIAAIEAKIGIDDSTDPTSMDYKLRNGLSDVVTLNDNATINTDASQGTVFDVTIAGNRTLANPTNPTNGQSVVWRVTQGGSGSNLLSYGSAFNFGAAGAPTLSTAVGKIDHIRGRYNSATSKWECSSSLGY